VTLDQSAAAAGLDRAAVRARIAAGQVNTAPPGPGRTVSQILRANVFTRFNAILGTLFVVVVAVGPPQDALFGIVLVVNTGFGVVQELRAKRTLDRLAILTAARARVIREGATAEIPVDQVVLDDVLDLRQGDQVPVDAAVLRAEGLEVDEALLTGEAEPVAGQPGERVLSGSFVVAGTGRVRAAGVGGEAYAARLQAQARRFSLIRSELQQGTNQILRLVTWVMIPAGLLVVISEFFRSHDPLEDAIRGSAAAVVAMVSEGLVLLTSLAFTAGAVRLARRRVLVQELAAVEGLARVDVLWIDKTGTLTRPGMRVTETRVLGRPAGRPDRRSPQRHGRGRRGAERDHPGPGRPVRRPAGLDGASASTVLFRAQVERRVVRRARHLAARRALRGRRCPRTPGSVLEPPGQCGRRGRWS
jgi:cation-transporting P-type ATPase E